MKVDHITNDNIVIESYRHEEKGLSMVTVTLYDGELILEAYSSADMNLKSEENAKVFILDKLGFTSEHIKEMTWTM